MTSKALVVLSGGQDSTTCLFWALHQGFDEVHAITFDYNQKHAIEIESARIIAQRAGVKTHKIVVLGPILDGTSPLVSGEELEQYEDGVLPGGLEKTFVPMRNQLFATIAANRAYVLGCRNLVMGVCQEDSGGYPDCRQEFIDAVALACNTGTFTGRDGALDSLRIHTPLMNLTKAASVDMARRIPGCYEALAYSHTSYDGQYPPVGFDHATVLRPLLPDRRHVLVRHDHCGRNAQLPGILLYRLVEVHLVQDLRLQGRVGPDEARQTLDALDAHHSLRLREDRDVFHLQQLPAQILRRLRNEPHAIHNGEHALNERVQQLVLQPLQHGAEHQHLFLVPLRDLAGRHIPRVVRRQH